MPGTVLHSEQNETQWEGIHVLPPCRLSDMSTGYINHRVGEMGDARTDVETENDSKWPLNRLFGESLLNELRKMVNARLGSINRSHE